MPIGFRLGWAIGVIALFVTGCSVIAPNRGNADSPNETQGPTVEIRGRSPTQDGFVPKSINVRVALGNVFVTVVEKTEDVNHVLIVARNVLLTDNSNEKGFILDTVRFGEKQDGDMVEFVEILPGTGAPELETHLYVQKEVPIKIVAERGNIQISGNTGEVTAQASGSISAWGTTNNLTLTAKSGITVDSAHKQLTLRTENGPIQVTAEDVNVTASTGAGDIFFAGKLLSGTSSFTTSSGSNITVMMPRFDVYEIEANTTVNTIDVQFPSFVDNRSTPVCGTFDAGAPYVIRADDRDHRERGQVTINKGDTRSVGAASLNGIVTQRSFAFHSTARNLLLEIPQVSEFFMATLLMDGLSPTPTMLSLTLPAPQVPIQSATIPPEILSGFQGTPSAAVEIPIDQVPTGSPPAAQATPAALITGDVRMYPARCPIPPADRGPARVKVIAVSNGGHIRIYQNFP